MSSNRFVSIKMKISGKIFFHLLIQEQTCSLKKMTCQEWREGFLASISLSLLMIMRVATTESVSRVTKHKGDLDSNYVLRQNIECYPSIPLLYDCLTDHTSYLLYQLGHSCEVLCNSQLKKGMQNI